MCNEDLECAFNRAVATAIGFTRWIAVDASKPASSPPLFAPMESIVEHLAADDPRMPDEHIPQYSTDLNTAFAAAEKVGLFSETFWRTLGMDELGESWCVFDQDGCVKRSLTENCSTPALAICKAILELSKDQPHATT